MMEFWNRLSAREKNILYVTIFLLVILAGYHGIWNPGIVKFQQLDEQIFAYQMKIRKAKTFLRQKDQVAEEVAKYPNLEQMNAGTDEEEIAQLLNFIEQAARDHTVSLSDVKPEQVQSDKWSKRYIIVLNAESKLSNLIEFIYALQYSPQLLKIERVDTAPKEDESRTLRSSLTVTRVVVK